MLLAVVIVMVCWSLWIEIKNARKRDKEEGRRQMCHTGHCRNEYKLSGECMKSNPQPSDCAEGGGDDYPEIYEYEPAEIDIFETVKKYAGYRR